MYDLDGSYSYSKMIAIEVHDATAFTFTPTGIEKLFPNPTNANLNVLFNVSENIASFNLQAYDITGAVLYQQQLQLEKGKHTIPIDVSILSTGQYILSITNPINNVTYEQKFIKQ